MGAKRIGILAAALTAAAMLASPTQAAEKATLLLNWFQLPDHSPFYLARKRGYFEEEGIDLEIIRGHGSGDTAKKIDLGEAEFGISDAPTVLTAISKGADLMIIGIHYDKAANNIFFFKDSGITKVSDLAGRKIAAPPGDSHRFLWPSLAKVNNVDPDSVTMVNIKPEGKQAIVAGGQVDGAFDLYTSFPIWEKVLGEGKVGNLLFADHGVALYGHAYLVNKKLVAEKPELIRGFMKAMARGWSDALNEREAAIDALMDSVPGVDRDAYLATLDLVLDLSVTERSREYGQAWILPELMQNTIDITKEGGNMEKDLTAAEVFTNDFNAQIKPGS
ncbi:ABC transporter substrate-binding protein [Oceanibacterium hippocampi]|uniref:Putative thiamine biosynthesis protein n=1 Tax=Oceanibacterium hippocampi TaxID=745714 RepID=A0A1Y5RXU5_9PROT|nr:ABC transporter substrate-binding protein [Oceanibacterium hippocampi]SLN27835.1 Putative thiamine biosynthesis protein [Oceanibacterium hippocampi]